jgi:hypothetical protein
MREIKGDPPAVTQPEPHLRGDLELIDAPDAPQISDLVAYWEGKRAGRPMPRRADIDPTELGSHLPNIFMVDVLDGGADFRYRLLGTAIVAGLGRDSTGRKLKHLYRDQPEAFAGLAALFRKVVTERRPAFARGHIFWLPARDLRRFSGGYVPLSDDGATVNIILAELFLYWPR